MPMPESEIGLRRYKEAAKATLAQKRAERMAKISHITGHPKFGLYLLDLAPVAQQIVRKHVYEDKDFGQIADEMHPNCSNGCSGTFSQGYPDDRAEDFKRERR